MNNCSFHEYSFSPSNPSSIKNKVQYDDIQTESRIEIIHNNSKNQTNSNYILNNSINNEKNNQLDYDSDSFSEADITPEPEHEQTRCSSSSRNMSSSKFI